MPERPSPAAPPPPRRRGSFGARLLFGVVLLALVGFGIVAAYAWVTLHYAYSEGERAGYVQKFSRKGWICKTWEGELAMVNLPGAMPQIFAFTVRDPQVADRVNQTIGQRVALVYEQHKGVPSDCFGETEYFVKEVRSVEPAARPQAPPATPPAMPVPTPSPTPH